MFDALRHAVTITVFVLVMMLAIEYAHVCTRGAWLDRLARRRGWGVVLGAALGATPGCLGAFSVVSLYEHRRLGFGALVAAMIATSGDEAFVLLSMVPRAALGLGGLLFVLAVLTGALVDRLGPAPERRDPEAHPLELHAEPACRCASPFDVLRQVRRRCRGRETSEGLASSSFSRLRGALVAGALTVIALLASGGLGPGVLDAKLVVFLLGVGFALFVFVTAPDHFLEAHVFDHVLRRHGLRIFLWTAGVLVLLHGLEAELDVGALIRENAWAVLVLAAVVGVIPESGPHLAFVTLYAQGQVPFGVLLASSVVQDGHGALPLLAGSRRAFVWMKLINLAVGLAAGAIALAAAS